MSNSLNAKRPPVRLLIAEEGASVAHRRTSGNNGHSELAIFVPAGSDSPSRLALRTLRHIADIERSGQRISRAVITAGARSDGQVLAARSLVARALIAHQTAVGCGELVLVTRADAGSRAQHELLALAGTLTSELGTSRISIRVLIDCATERASSDGQRTAQSSQRAQGPN